MVLEEDIFVRMAPGLASTRQVSSKFLKYVWIFVSIFLSKSEWTAGLKWLRTVLINARNQV